jgi:hypothetical protein
MGDDNGDEARYREIETIVEEHMHAERLLRATHELRNLPPYRLTPRHHQILSIASDFEASIADLIEDPDSDGSWKKQGEQHGKRDVLIYYKVDDKARLTCRIETAIEASLLVPILSVMNESELYATWIPSWTIPKLGIDYSELLEQTSRVAQIIRIGVNVPWPVRVDYFKLFLNSFRATM